MNRFAIESFYVYTENESPYITKIAIFISIVSKGKKLPELKSKKIKEITSDEISKNENTASYISFLCPL